jgi:hypothetical protein
VRSPTARSSHALAGRHQGAAREVTATAQPSRGTACAEGSGHTSSCDRGAGLGIVVSFAETCCRCRQNSPAQSHARAAFSPLRWDRRWPGIDGPTADSATGRPKGGCDRRSHVPLTRRRKATNNYRMSTDEPASFRFQDDADEIGGSRGLHSRTTTKMPSRGSDGATADQHAMQRFQTGALSSQHWVVAKRSELP